MNKIVSAVLAVLALMLIQPTAHAEYVTSTYRFAPPVYKPATTVQIHAVRVDPKDHGAAMVVFTNGSWWMVAPCAAEDSERCWWDAHVRGNRIGNSFVRLHHHTYYLKNAK